MKHYEKEYRDYISLPRKRRKEFIVEGMNKLEMLDVLGKVKRKRDLMDFEYVVRIEWLARKLCIKGLSGEDHRRTYNYVCRSTLNTFAGDNLNDDLVGNGYSIRYGMIAGYLDDFFPGFERDNPFLNPEKYQFPYKNISITQMMIVVFLRDRLGLLEYAEKNKLKLYEFINYVANHVMCASEYGDDRKANPYPIYTGRTIDVFHYEGKGLSKKSSSKRSKL